MFISRNQLVCLMLGVAVGVGAMAVVGPTRELKASSTDRNSNFAMVTCPADDLGQHECVFVLDFFNGTLVGGVINNQTGKYMHRYYRVLGQDFQIDPNTPEPKYAIVGTRTNIQGNAAGRGLIHIAENTSGRVIAYGFAFPNRANPNNPLPLKPLDFMQFREATASN